MRRILLFSAVAVTLAVPAAGQENGNPGGMLPGTDLNAADRVFAIALAQGGLAEVNLGQLAAKSAQSEEVKEFAGRMVADHSEANDRFTDIARREGLTLPKELDPEHRAIAENLSKQKGEKFDLEYLRTQVADHQKTAQLLEYEIGQGQNKAVQDFATNTLETILAHLKMAQDIMGKLTGQASR